MPILTRKVSQTGLLLACDQGSLVPVGLCMQDYKSLYVAVTICATLVNIQSPDKETDRHTDRKHVTSLDDVELYMGSFSFVSP